MKCTDLRIRLGNAPGRPGLPLPKGLCLICLVCVGLPGSLAGEYYVSQGSPSASDSNSGTAIEPWLTICHAASVLVPGDVVRVLAGTYDERPTPANSGSAGNMITFKGVGGVVVRGFDLTGRRYIRVAGFEITHPTTAYNYPGVELRNANHCEVLDCHIHHVNGQGVNIHTWNAYGNNNVVRSNRLAYIGMCQTNMPQRGAAAIAFSGTNNLIEYNDISFCGDFFNGHGYQNVFRNNYLHDISADVINPDPHVDGLQQSPGSGNIDTRWTLFEKNYCYSSMLLNSHGILVRNITAGKTVRDIVCRQNVIDFCGSVFIETHIPFVRAYNNTVSRCSELTGNGFVVSVATDAAASATNCVFLNNIYWKCATNKGTVYAVVPELTNSFQNDYDLRYLSGTSFNPPEAHGLASDPAFSSGFYLSADSPAVGAAGAQTITSSAGSVTNVVAVADAGFFCDGWSIVSGDLVTVGTNVPIAVTNIDYANNLLYVSTNISWPGNAPVYLDGTRDIGAHRYRPEGHIFSILLVAPTNRASVLGTTVLSADVTNPGAVRFVRFYVDGLDVGTATTSPYSVTAELSILSHVVEARAYALYADPTLVRSDVVHVNQPQPPVGLEGVP